MYCSHEIMISALSNQRRGRKRQFSELELYSDTLYTSTKRSRSTGAYDPNFRQRMINNGIYPDGYTYPNGQVLPEPQNWNELQRVLAKPRRLLSSCPKERYDEFKQADAEVTGEDDVMSKLISRIQGTVPDANVTGNIPFNNLADMMRGKSHKAKPGRFYGARTEQLHQDLPDKLQALIVPSTEQARPIAPNYFVEAKSPKGSAFVASNQACFAGAAGARGIHSLRTYGERQPKYDNNAYNLSATYHSGTLKIYSHHVSLPHGSGTQPEYYMHQLNGWLLTANKEALIQGITAFRNARSWTAAQRNTAINCANAVAIVVNPLAPRPAPAPQNSIPQKMRKWWTALFSPS